MRKALPLLIVMSVCLICLAGCAGTAPASSESMRMSVSDGSHTVVFRLNDSTPAKSLYGMLPLDVTVGDFLYNEKIFYPPEKVDGTDGMTGSGDAGDLALYYPWGDVVMYIGPFESNAGLFLLGTAESGAEHIKDLGGTIHVDRL